MPTAIAYYGSLPTAIAYYRASVDISGDARSIGSQQSEARHIAEREGWELPHDDDHEFTDTVSASVFALRRGKERTGFGRLIERIERGGVHAVIIAEVSRGTREQVAFQQLAEACIKHGTIINAKGKNFDPEDETDSFQLGLDVLLAAMESTRISRRTKRGVRTSISAGRPPAGRVPFGYYRPPRGPDERVTQLPHDTHADIVRTAAKRVLEDKASLAQIAREWNALTGKSWDHAAVRKALLNPSLIGRRVVGSSTVPGNWEAILSVETHYALHAKLGDKSRRTSSGPESTTMLSGIGLCGVCGSKLCVRRDGYRCRKGACTGRRIAWVDQFVSEAAVYALAAQLRDQLIADLRGFDPAAVDAEEFARARGALETAERELADFEAEAASAGLPAAIVVRTLTGYTEKVGEARARLEELSAPTQQGGVLEEVREASKLFEAAWSGPAEALPAMVRATYGEELFDTAEEIWAGLDLEGKRRVIKKLLDVRLLKPLDATRVGRSHPKAMLIEPRDGEWEEGWRPWWVTPGASGTIEGLFFKI